MNFSYPFIRRPIGTFMVMSVVLVLGMVFVGRLPIDMLPKISYPQIRVNVNNPGVERVKAECVPNDENCPTYKTGRAKQLRTNILIGVTATLGVATGVLGAIGVNWGGSKKESESDDATGLRVEPWVALGDGASVGAWGTF